MDVKTSYEILEVDFQADEGTIKKAYKIQVRRWHPDRFPQGAPNKAEAEERLKQINIAYARIKEHLALHRTEPAGPSSTPSEKPSSRDFATDKASSEKSAGRSWADHLFDALNAFAGSRADTSQTSSGNRDKARKKRSFEDVLGEMTGKRPPSGKKPNRSEFQQRHATLRQKYRGQGGRVGKVEPMQDKGPVKPVGRVRGIGRSR